MTERVAFTISAPLPVAASKAAAIRQRRAVERAVHAWQGVLESFPPDELEALAMHIERNMKPLPVSEQKTALVAALSDGHEFSQQERLALEVTALQQYFAFRRSLLSGALTATQVANLLGTSRQTPHDRVKSGSLLAILDRGVLRFPAWQFDAAGADGVIPGLPAVVRVLRVPPLSKVSWLVQPNPYLDGLTPRDALKHGDVERVLALARAVEAD